jgi:hypothetical protein
MRRQGAPCGVGMTEWWIRGGGDRLSGGQLGKKRVGLEICLSRAARLARYRVGRI